MVISVMREITTLGDLKGRLQAGFENNEESLEAFGKTYSTQLKAYLIESNQSIVGAGCPIGKWRGLDSTGWYGNQDENFPNTLFLDGTRERVWIIYSILDAAESDLAIKNWVESRKGLDRCWLSRKQLLHWEGMEQWSQSGLGLRFSDGLYPEEEAGKFSLKAWYGANRYIVGLDEVIEKAKERFAIYSARWQKRRNGSVAISAEWYSNGKATINRAIDVDEVLLSISEMANRYDDAISDATELRDTTLCAFEIDFSQEIDLDAFSNTVAKGTGEMKLWLVETEAEADFRRFRGVDLHTWDRILLDVGPDFAYLTIPGKGCVNAAPRIATIQGEDNAGKTSIFHDGVEIFA
jgi:hypothetical protein